MSLMPFEKLPNLPSVTIKTYFKGAVDDQHPPTEQPMARNVL